MRKFFQIAVFSFLFFISGNILAQDKVSNDPDMPLKVSLYTKYRREVRAFDKNDFDKLFFEFFEKQNQKQILTKDEYYMYTVKIAIYSEKYGLLYKKEKANAEKTKAEWMSKMYSDYLKSKKK
jgi:hypothetical protein